MTSKICLCAFVLVSTIEIWANLLSKPTTPISYKAINVPVVIITRTKEMTSSMQLDAVEAFKRAYAHLNSSTDRCSIVRQIFVEKYPDFKWHVAMYKAYSIQSVKSIDIKVNQDSFVLFATNK